MICACDKGHSSLDAANWKCPWCEIERLRRKIESLEAGLAALRVEDQPAFIRLRAELEDAKKLTAVASKIIERNGDGALDAINQIDRDDALSQLAAVRAERDALEALIWKFARASVADYVIQAAIDAARGRTNG